MNENMELWEALDSPPKWALKVIKGGRMSGKTDINPQWRYQAMTEHFGPCGKGWRFSVEKVWSEEGGDGQKCAFAMIKLEYKTVGKQIWNEPVFGMGGSMMVAQEKGRLYTNDECYKMAITDALGTAMKMIGVAAKVYAGKWDGTKYADVVPDPKSPKAKVRTIRNSKEVAVFDAVYEVLLGMAPENKFPSVKVLENIIWPLKESWPNDTKKVDGIVEWLKKNNRLPELWV